MDEVPSSRANAKAGSDLILTGAGQRKDTRALIGGGATRAGSRERHCVS